jgi:hypothetical protein
MPAIEWCECCLAEAPAASADWYVLTTREGEHLGVVCAGCVADEELMLLELEAARATVKRSRTRARGRLHSRSRGARRGRRAPSLT